jgi:uncharacterized protein YggE
MATASTARSMPRFATRGVLLAVVIVLFAMVALALLAEALTSGDGGTVYLAEIQPGSSNPVAGPSLLAVGYGKATVAAKSAEIQMFFSSDEGDFSGPVTEPTPGATPGDPEREAAAPIVVAVVGAGVPEDDVRVVINPMFRSRYGPPWAMAFRVDVTLANPDLEAVNRLVDAAEMSALDERIRLTRVGVGYGIAECDALRAQAWDLAVADARARADEQASKLGVVLGDLLVAQDAAVGDATDLLAMPSTVVGCAPTSADPLDGLATLLTGSGVIEITLPPFDPTQPSEVVAFAQVSLAYEIVPEE